MPYTVLGQPRGCLLGLSAALTISGLELLASVGSTVNYLFLQAGRRMQTLFTVQAWFSQPACYRWSLLQHCKELTDYACTVVALLLLMNYTLFTSIQMPSSLATWATI